MTQRADVVVVGGGIEGTAVAWALTRRGVVDVVVLERRTIGSGGTGKSSGIVRCHYGVPSLAAMAAASLPLFENARDVLGVDVGFQQIGYLVGVGPADAAALSANVAMQQGLGVDAELVTGEAAQRLWPWADFTGFAAFGYEPRGGHADAYLTCQAFAAGARRGGARIRQHAPVRALTASAGRVTGVELDSGERISAATVVLAAGYWSVALAAPVGVELPLESERAQLLLVDPGRPLGPVPVLSDLVGLQYLRTERSGHLLVGDSDHRKPHYADPDGYPERAEPAFLESAVSRLAARFPALDGASVTSSYAGCYDVTPDYNPIIGPAAVPGLLLCVGFSGHGFKISPAVGELIADLICAGDSQDPAVRAADFRYQRFGEGAPLTSPHPYAEASQMR